MWRTTDEEMDFHVGTTSTARAQHTTANQDRKAMGLSLSPSGHLTVVPLPCSKRHEDVEQTMCSSDSFLNCGRATLRAMQGTERCSGILNLKLGTAIRWHLGASFRKDQ